MSEFDLQREDPEAYKRYHITRSSLHECIRATPCASAFGAAYSPRAAFNALSPLMMVCWDRDVGHWPEDATATFLGWDGEPNLELADGGYLEFTANPVPHWRTYYISKDEPSPYCPLFCWEM